MIERTKFESGTFYLGDCFEVMAGLEAGSIDMVLADLPYGTTACAWDSVLPLEQLWSSYKSICNGNMVFTASQPFTSMLLSSNIKDFRYQMTWVKDRPSNPALAKKRPLNYTEDILVFYKSTSIYNPQMEVRPEKNKRNNKNERFSTEASAKLGDSFLKTGMSDFTYPKNYLKFNCQRGLHPTQKPVALFEYLIRTYTNEGMTVLDNTAGSGTTAIAAMNVGRRWICIEKDETYYRAAVERVRRHEEKIKEAA